MPVTMQALIFKDTGDLRLESRPLPELREPTDGLVRVRLSSICSSDLHIRNGAVPRARPGVVLGHEFVGEVVETGREVRRVRPGQRVAVNVETFCGQCFFCRQGFVNNCEQGGWELGCRIDGCQTEYVRVPPVIRYSCWGPGLSASVPCFAPVSLARRASSPWTSSATGWRWRNAWALPTTSSSCRTAWTRRL